MENYMVLGLGDFDIHVLEELCSCFTVTRVILTVTPYTRGAW